MNRLSERENILRAIHFQTPGYIPVTYKINPSYYFANDVDAVLDFQARHPLLFPGFGRPDTREFMENLKKNLHPDEKGNSFYGRFRLYMGDQNGGYDRSRDPSSAGGSGGF